MDTLTFPPVSFPFLSAETKFTNFAHSPYSDFFAWEALRFWAFSTSLFISWICFFASAGLKVTTLFSVIVTFLFLPVFSLSIPYSKVKLILQIDLMVVNFNDLFVLHTEIFKPGIYLVQGKICSFKELW